MAEALISSLLPIVVTLFLGFFAGWRKDFGEQQAGSLNKLVMNYTLPLSLFGGIMTTQRASIFSHLAVAGWLLVAMVGGYLVVVLIARFLLHQSTALAALRAMAIAGPAIPFVGPTILGSLFPSESALLISLGGLIMNIVQVPVTVIMLSTASQQHTSVGANLLGAIKKPVVWAPILALSSYCAVVSCHRRGPRTSPSSAVQPAVWPSSLPGSFYSPNSQNCLCPSGSTLWLRTSSYPQSCSSLC